MALDRPARRGIHPDRLHLRADRRHAPEGARLPRRSPLPRDPHAQPDRFGLQEAGRTARRRSSCLPGHLGRPRTLREGRTRQGPPGVAALSAHRPGHRQGLVRGARRRPRRTRRSGLRQPHRHAPRLPPRPSRTRWGQQAQALVGGLLSAPEPLARNVDPAQARATLRGALGTLAEGGNPAFDLEPVTGNGEILVLSATDEHGLALLYTVDPSGGPDGTAGVGWGALAVLDDQDQDQLGTAAHKLRWRSWLYWSNLLQFLAFTGGDGVQLAGSRAADFAVEVLRASGGPGELETLIARLRPGTAAVDATAPADVTEPTTGRPRPPPPWSRRSKDCSGTSLGQGHPRIPRRGRTRLRPHPAGQDARCAGKKAPVFGYELGDRVGRPTSPGPVPPRWRCSSTPTPTTARNARSGTTPIPATAGPHARQPTGSTTSTPCSPCSRTRKAPPPMTARLSLYEKAEQELYKLDRSVKGKFYDFCHRFRQNPDHPGLDLRPLKGDGRVHRAKIDQSYRALLAKIGIDGAGREKWLVVAVRHRKHVYEELSVAINRITGEIEFVNLSVVGQSVLQRAGMTLTPAEQPDVTDEPKTPAAVPPTAEPADARPTLSQAELLLADVTAEELRDLGVAEQLIDLALAVTESTELDALVSGAPSSPRTSCTALPQVCPSRRSARDHRSRRRRTRRIRAPRPGRCARPHHGHHHRRRPQGRHRRGRLPCLEGLPPPRPGEARRPPLQRAVQGVRRPRHRQNHRRPPSCQAPRRTTAPGHSKPILLTTFTKNLTTDLRARLASLLEPDLLARVDITHIDQLAARVLNENTVAGAGKQRIYDNVALSTLRQALLELDEKRWDAEFLYEEWGR